MAILLASGAAGGWVWHKANSVPPHLRDDTPWDPEITRRCLAGHAELVERLEHIGSLTTRSSCGMPANYNGFIAARTGKTGCDILLLKARDMGCLAGNPTSDVAGFQPLLFKMMP